MARTHFLPGVILVSFILLLTSSFVLAFSEQELFNDERNVARTPEEALRYDAIWYADHFGVSIDEAVYRLGLQQRIGELNAILIEQEKHTYAGLWITHLPEYEVHIAFTNEPETTIEPYLRNSPLQEFVTLESAKFSYDELSNNQVNITQYLVVSAIVCNQKSTTV